MELFRMLHMPRGTTLEKLTFGNILGASNEIIRNSDALKVNCKNETKNILQ
jgi:dynein heavy chain 2